MFVFHVVRDIETRGTYATIKVVAAFGFPVYATSFSLAIFLIKSDKDIAGLSFDTNRS